MTLMHVEDVLGKASESGITGKTINHEYTHLTQATLGVENTPTVDAVVMTLTVVFMQANGELEEPVTSSAVVVCVDAVCDQLVMVVKVLVTIATVMMAGTLDVVLFETPPGVKVPITIITVVMIGRVQKVLAVRGPVPEIAVTGMAIWHP